MHFDVTMLGRWLLLGPARHTHQSLIQKWDGTAWTLVIFPSTILTETNVLSGVTCSSASDCWVAGYYISGSGPKQTLLEHWNGNTWSIINSPNSAATENNALSHVSCASTSNCWAVGEHGSSSGPQQTLVEQWNGMSWSIATSPNPNSSQQNILQSVACPAQSECWAVGHYVIPNSLPLPLIERYTVPVPLLGVISRQTHGDAGSFDIDLLGSSGVECRSGGASSDHTVVFTFANPLAGLGV
jgi:hypothetical protein